MTWSPAKLSAQSVQPGTQPWSQYSPTSESGTTCYALDFIKISHVPVRNQLVHTAPSKWKFARLAALLFVLVHSLGRWMRRLGWEDRVINSTGRQILPGRGEQPAAGPQAIHYPQNLRTAPPCPLTSN
jgi:hypothetical protein